jgi:4-hydroxybenzoate polyprenyltransferase
MGSLPRPGWRLRYRIEAIARFIRVFSLGATLLPLLVGVSTARGEVTVGAVAWAVLFGILFHVFADVANDVMDLSIDRTDPRRMREPLVLGSIKPELALMVALLAVPVMLGCVLFSDAERSAGPLVAAIVLIGGYDIVGKSIPMPFVADVLEGAGGGALVFAGAGLAGGATTATLWAAGFAATYVAMANGLHGAIRDVQNDARVGARTTAVLLGVRIDGGTRVTVPRSVVVQAVTLQAAMGVLLVGFLDSGRPPHLDRGWTVAVGCGLCVYLASTVMLVAAWKARGTLRMAMAAGTWHLFLAPLSLVAAATWRGPGWATITMLGCFIIPPLLFGWAVRGTEFGLPSTIATRPVRAVGTPGCRLAAIAEMTRPGTPAAAAALTLAGGVVGGGIEWAIVPAMLATALAVAAANVYNDRCDLATDRVNRPYRPLPAGVLTTTDGDRFVLAAALAVIASAVTVGLAEATVAAILLVVALLYSLALRQIPLAGAVTVAALFATPLPYGGWVSTGELTAKHWVACFLILLFVFARETLKAVPDRPGDMTAGYWTIATRRGEAAALAVFKSAAVAFCVAAVAVAPIVNSLVYLMAALVCAVAPTVYTLRLVRGTPTPEAIENAISFSGRVFGLGIIPILLMR